MNIFHFQSDMLLFLINFYFKITDLFGVVVKIVSKMDRSSEETAEEKICKIII